jgi:hypothetical protein
VVESDAACTSLSGYSSRKSALLFWYEATKPEVIQNKICEGTDCLNAALSSDVTSLQVMVASARSLGWGSNEKLTLLYLEPYPSALMYSMQTHVSLTFLINATYHLH